MRTFGFMKILHSCRVEPSVPRVNIKVQAFTFSEPHSKDMLVYGCVSQGRGTAKSLIWFAITDESLDSPIQTALPLTFTLRKVQTEKTNHRACFQQKYWTEKSKLWFNTKLQGFTSSEVKSTKYKTNVNLNDLTARGALPFPPDFWWISDTFLTL